MRTFLLQTLPFLISILVGVFFFFLEEYQISHTGVSDLIIGVASVLLSIPLVFIFYQMSSNYSRKKIKKVVTDHVIFEMNYVIVRLLKDLRLILGFKPELTKDNLYGFLLENRQVGKKNLHFKKEYVEKFSRYKKQILGIVYSSPGLDIMSDDAIQNILSIAKELGIIGIELEAKNKNRDPILRASVETLIDDIDRWIEFCELSAVVSHHSFSLVE
ncbi:MAG: hypothetical protein LBU87_02435 [Lactobacillales bacterium]|jgi:hypothetical protein|nr:hypothetical protein [Lactobacillales bacterium]